MMVGPFNITVIQTQQIVFSEENLQGFRMKMTLRGVWVQLANSIFGSVLLEPSNEAL